MGQEYYQNPELGKNKVKYFSESFWGTETEFQVKIQNGLPNITVLLVKYFKCFRYACMHEFFIRGITMPLGLFKSRTTVFMHVAIDNNEFLEETLSGKKYKACQINSFVSTVLFNIVE